MQTYLRSLSVIAVLVVATCAEATPYASSVQVSGTTVTFLTNENSDTLKYSINGGALIDLPDGADKGSHTFTLNSPSDKFSIVAERVEDGFTSLTGNTIAALTNSFGLSRPMQEGVVTVITDDASPTNSFNSPRGVSVSKNPNAPNFGIAYISNSATGAIHTGRGLYALAADQSDPYNIGTAAAQDAVFGAGNSANTPYRVTVAADGSVYVAGFSDALSNVWRLSPNLQTIDALFAGTTGPTALPAGQNHGSSIAMYIEGSTAQGNLTAYVLDEDLTTSFVTGSGSTTDKGSAWKYNIGGSTLPYSAMPTKLVGLPAEGATGDIDRGADGKFYVSENRSAGNEAGLIVTDANGAILWDSSTASKALAPPAAGNKVEADYNTNDFVDAADYVTWRHAKDVGPALTQAANNEVGAPLNTTDQVDYDAWRARFGRTADILTNVTQIAVSPDQKWLAGMTNGSDVVVIPLVNGLPDLANMRLLDSGNINSGRDIAFDAAGNIHYVSSGQALYRVLAPGGHTVSTLAWDGASYSFNVQNLGAGLGSGVVPEPGSILLAIVGLGLVGAIRRRT